jgi:hypothetical protein
MLGKIFISYRREDDPGFALALFGRLEQSFPTERLFMDVEGGIKAGEDFVRVIEEQVNACDVMLALIGPKWLMAVDEMGQRRLDNPQDFVRIEIESGLRLGKRVIPVLVHKTEMPRADALPEPLKPLARRNAVGLTQDRFKADAQGLITALEGALAEAEVTRQQAATKAAADEQRRAAEQAAKVEEAARAEKERARLDAIAGLSPEHIAKAEELANWDFIKASENSQDFRDHLARFPKGVTERMAWTKLETLVWAGLAQPVDASSLRAFLEEFPNGAHAAEVKSKLEDLARQAAAAREAEEHQRRETEAWASASAAGNVAAFEAFLKDWPESNEANVARKRIKEIKGVPTRRWLLQGLGAAVGLIVAGATFVELQPGRLLWRLLYDQSIRTFAGHSLISSVAFAPDGRTALSGGGDKRLKLWDVAAGQAIRTFTGHSGSILSVAFAPDGRTALSGSNDDTLKLWDVAAGREIRTFTGHSGSINSVAFAPDGRTALSGSDDKTLKLWDVATGGEIRTFTGHSESILSVAFAPDGRTALSGAASNLKLSGSDKTTLKLWDVATGQEIRTFTGRSASIDSVAFAPDGRTALSGGLDATLNLWDVSAGREIRTFTGHSGSIKSVAFSPDGRTALSGSFDNTLKLWDITDLK